MKQNKMKIIGVTGGIGSGKTEILNYLRLKYNAYVIYLDEVGREAQIIGNEAYLMIKEKLGDEYILSNKELDRQKIASLIYKDLDMRLCINNIVHPIVKKNTISLLKSAKGEKRELAIIEAALLLEDNYDKICDEIWYIFADKKVRIERLIQSRGYSVEKCEDIISSQLSDDDFKRGCSVIIDNSGSIEETFKVIDKNIVRIKGEL